MTFTPYCEPVNDWLRWPGQPAYYVGGVGQLAVNGRVVDSLYQGTLLLIGPNEVFDVAVVNKMWQIKSELDGQLLQRLIARYQGHQ